MIFNHVCCADNLTPETYSAVYRIFAIVTAESKMPFRDSPRELSPKLDIPTRRSFQIVEDLFVVAPPNAIAEALADGWAERAWPGLQLRLERDRTHEGRVWSVTGELIGTMEVWLEPVLDGTVFHFFLWAEPGQTPRPKRTPISSNPEAHSSRGERRIRRTTHRLRLATRAAMTHLKARLEEGRQLGCPPSSS